MTVAYGSIVNGVTVTGSRSFEYGGGKQTFTFTPPANCTKLTVTITSASGVTLQEITLNNA